MTFFVVCFVAFGPHKSSLNKSLLNQSDPMLALGLLSKSAMPNQSKLNRGVKGISNFAPFSQRDLGLSSVNKAPAEANIGVDLLWPWQPKDGYSKKRQSQGPK